MMDYQKRKAQKAVARNKSIISLLTAACIMLSAALGVSVYIYAKHRSNFEAAIQRLNGTIDEKDRIIDEDMISLEEFKDYCARYGVNTKFVQHFVEDAIVYTNQDGIVYSPINKSLKKSFVDASLISTVNERRVYSSDKIQTKTVVDVSRYQQGINWTSVAADGIDGAMIRVGYRGYNQAGPIQADGYFSQNITGAINAGLDVGVYFFSQAITKEEAVEEADYVLSKISGHKVTLPIVFDMELMDDADERAADLTAKEVTDVTIAFCERIKEKGYTPMIYGNVAWMCDKLELERLEGYKKWLAQYSSTPYFPYEYSMWQYTESGKVNGISGNADINLMFVGR